MCVFVCMCVHAHVNSCMHIQVKSVFDIPEQGGLSECERECWIVGADRFNRRPHVATFIFICLARGKFLTCCLKIFLCLCNLGLREIIGFKNFI